MIYRLALVCALIFVNGFAVVAQEEAGELVPSGLLEGVISGNLDEIRTAVGNGEPIDLVNDNGWSAARFAVSLGNMDALRTLIDLGIDLNNPDNQGFTPLMAASKNVRVFFLHSSS